MQIPFGNNTSPFVPWRPELGTVFEATFALDTETMLIDEQRRWLIPAYVLGAAYDGQRGFFVTREHLPTFLSHHRDVSLVLHNAPFDLAVMQQVCPAEDLYVRVEQDRVWDTQLMHRLYKLGNAGHTAGQKGESTLERCAQEYVGVELPKDLADSQGKSVRLSYGQWLHRNPQEIEPVYLEYLAKDAIATYQVFCKLKSALKQLLQESSDAFGYRSAKWLAQQIKRWGWQTHHIQLKGAIVLQSIQAEGLHVDVERLADLRKDWEKSQAARIDELRQWHYFPGQKGSGKALQEILRRLEREYPAVEFPRTETGAYCTSEEALEELRQVDPFIEALFAHRQVQKLLSTYVEKMGKTQLHPRFDVLKNTGRTSCFGDINAQNLPRDGGVRSCFVPPPGHVFIDADYSMIELVTLAQTVQRWSGKTSRMATAINDGKDLHVMVAAQVAKTPEEQVTKEERRRAKAINFGKPGGMGDKTLQQYAKANYGIRLSEEEVAALSQSWFDLFPEMEAFLSDSGNRGLAVAQLFELTPTSHFEHSGSRSFLDRCVSDDAAHEPHEILGGMCRKALGMEKPVTRDGRQYQQDDIDYFWAQAEKHVDLLPPRFQSAVRERRPSWKLVRAIDRLGDSGSVFTLTGRLRANASYCARHNTVFQGLAADGAKLGLWNLWRAGYRIVNFIHDEVLVAVPAKSRLGFHAERIKYLMQAGMKEVVPDMRVGVAYTITDRWYKEGKLTVDTNGRLEAWSAPQAA